MTALEAVLRRRSRSSVSPLAPTHDELLPFVEAAATVADHGDLKPWRLIELRGDSRLRLGQAFAEASGLEGKDAVKLAEKPLRASLLIAVVVSFKPSFKVHRWEQEDTASGVAHMLSLLLDEAGWGVFWRSGGHTRSAAVHRMHELGPDEELLGWLYVGGILKDKGEKKHKLNGARFVTQL